jgi:hypothetical protein
MVRQRADAHTARPPHMPKPRARRPPNIAPTYAVHLRGARIAAYSAGHEHAGTDPGRTAAAAGRSETPLTALLAVGTPIAAARRFARRE